MNHTAVSSWMKSPAPTVSQNLRSTRRMYFATRYQIDKMSDTLSFALGAVVGYQSEAKSSKIACRPGKFPRSNLARRS